MRPRRTFKNKILKIHYIMSDFDSRRSRAKLWLAFGAIVLIILLIIWLTVANLAGDTDVAACLPPLL